MMIRSPSKQPQSTQPGMGEVMPEKRGCLSLFINADFDKAAPLLASSNMSNMSS